MKKITLMFLILTAILFYSCASYTELGAMGYGYGEVRFDETTFKISYTGRPSSSREMAEDYALLRAAEVTLENSCNFFEITDMDNRLDKDLITTPAQTSTSITKKDSVTTKVITKHPKEVTVVTTPTVIYIIKIYKTKPDGKIYNAEFVQESVKKKYDL